MSRKLQIPSDHAGMVREFGPLPAGSPMTRHPLGLSLARDSRVRASRARGGVTFVTFRLGFGRAKNYRPLDWPAGSGFQRQKSCWPHIR